ncbi:MAG: AAA family ATPase [Candidatus Daviesbacteria bacterium]|nr:AAA family ATPase [Candidatus Daviesbacteria bacterium]
MRLNPESNTQVPKKLVVITGSSGTGKSTLAVCLGKEFGYPIVCKDIYASIFPASYGDEYQQLYRSDTHQKMREAIKILLSLGCSVIVDVVHSKEVKKPDWDGWIPWYTQVGKLYQAEVDFIRVIVTEKDQRERLERRNSPFDADKLSSPEAWQRFQKEQPINIDTHPENGLIVWNSRPFAETFAETKAFLLRPRPALSLVRSSLL